MTTGGFQSKNRSAGTARWKHAGSEDVRRKELMSDTATILREMDETFTDLRAVLREMDEASMFDWVTEEQASRVRRGVLAVRTTLIHIRKAHGPESRLAHGSGVANGREHSHGT
jgi:hypothetical protein